MKVIVADLNDAAAQAVVDEITPAHGYAVAKGFDITEEASYQELVEFTAREFGGLHGLFTVAADLSA
jgi:NAD(P)-dependent dehydrogenase (short-subunit alcohol dehydrogenase family)